MLYLTDDQIRQVLEWPDLVCALEKAFRELTETEGNGVPPRTILKAAKIPLTLYNMPSFSYSQDVVACKLVTQCPLTKEKYRLPSISGIVALFDINNGQLSAILDASVLTAWRTAAASLVAAKFLFCPEVGDYSDKTLTVLGAGEQGKIHIRAFAEYFKITKINLWNRKQERAEIASKELQEKHQIQVKVFSDAKKSVVKADIIIWAASATSTSATTNSATAASATAASTTSATATLARTTSASATTASATSARTYITKADLKAGAFIISVGTSPNMPSGLSADIFQNAQLFTENLASAKSEMEEFVERYNLQFAEIGEIILGRKSVVSSEEEGERGLVVYQSLGSAILDAVAGKLVVENYRKKFAERQ